MTKLLENYTRTLAVIGRFNTDAGGSPILVFDNTDPEVPNLSPADVFDRLKPELGLVTEEDLAVGEYVRKAVLLELPKAGGGDGAMQLTLDSMLLDVATDSGKRPQEVGGVLIKNLLRDLDVVARFAGTRFPKGLLEVARRYVNVDVDTRMQERNHIIGQHQINRLFGDPLCADAVLRVLTVFEGDLPQAERELKAALREVDPPLEAVNDSVREKMLEAIVNSVSVLRVNVLREGSDDPSWREMRGEGSVVDRHTQEAMAWVDDLDKDAEYQFEVGPIAGVNIGRSLRDRYNAYMDHADNVHRFVRSPVLHSYVFIWLMSKYGVMTRGNEVDVARSAYRRGVEGAEDRISSESEQDMKKRRRQAREGADEASRQLDQLINGAAVEVGDKERERLKASASVVVDAATRVFTIPSRFTRDDLLEVLERLFIEAASTTSGKLAEILYESIVFTKEFGRLYRKLLGILLSEDNWKLKSGDYRKKVIAELDTVAKGQKEGTTRAAFEDVIEDIKKLEDNQEKEEFGEEALSAFAHRTGVAAFTTFAEKYVDNVADLKAQEEDLRTLYRVASKIGRRDRATANETAEGVLPPSAAGLVENSEQSRNRLEKVLKRERSSEVGSFEVPIPREAEALLHTGDTPPEFLLQGICKGEEVEVGRVRITESAQVVTINEEVPYELVKMGGDEAVPSLELKLPSDARWDGKLPAIKQVDPKGAMTEVLEARIKGVHEEQKFVGQIDHLASYGETRDKLRDLYVGKDTTGLDEETRARAQRTLRALSFGEIVPTAADEVSFLGKQNVSEPFQLLIDIVKEIGDLANKNLANPEPDEVSGLALGPKEEGEPKASFNLSKYFPFQKDEKVGRELIESAISYHQALCRSVEDVLHQLRDLNDLRVLAAAMPVDGRLVVVNCTLEEYAAEVERQVGVDLSRSHHPSLLYLPHSAGLKKVTKAWETIGEALVDGYRERYEPRKAGEPEAPTFSCPVVVAADEEHVGSCPYPVVRLGALRDIKFRPRPYDQDKLGRGGVLKRKSRHVRSDVIDGLVVDDPAYVMSITAAMALAVFAPNQKALGSLSEDPPSREFQKAFRRKTSLSFLQGEDVIGLLRRFWRRSEVDRVEFEGLSSFLLARLASLALIWTPGRPKREAFTDFLAAADLQAPNGTQDINTETKPGHSFLESALFADMRNSSVEFFKTRNLNTNMAESGVEEALFRPFISGTGEQGPTEEVYCRIRPNDDATHEFVVELPRETRKRLHFLQV